MKEEGYIPISRRMFEHPFWCEERVFSRFEAWLDLLQESRFENTRQLIGGKFLTIKRGQIPVSLRFLATRWKWSTKKVNSFLDLLICDKMIMKETLKETGQTVVTICNYDRYNQNSKTRKREKKHSGNSEETLGKQRGNTRETNKKKGNKGSKGSNNPLPLESDFVLDEFRNTFSLWLEYKTERKESYKSERSIKMCFEKLLKLSENTPALAAEIVNQSIANNWAGLFALKTKDNGNKNEEDATDSGSVIIRTTRLQ